MAKKKNKISYISLVMVLFGLIATFLICRNLLILKNNVELEATCYGYEFKNNKYLASYFYEYNGKAYNIKIEEADKPKVSSKIKVNCNKDNASKCLTNKKEYLSQIYISILVLIPAMAFVFLDIKRQRIKSDTNKNQDLE